MIQTRRRQLSLRVDVRRLALAAIAGPGLLTVAWLVLGFVSPGYSLWGTRIAPYSSVSQPVSGLGLGPTGPFMNAAFVLSGMMIIAGVLGIFRSIPELGSRTRWILTGLMALPGIGSVLDGMFTFEHFFFHFLGFTLALTTVVSFPIAGLYLRPIPTWRRLATWLVVAGPLTLILTVLYFATFTPTIQGVQSGFAGLTERALIIELQAWYVAMGWLVFRGSSRYPPFVNHGEG